MFPYPSSRLRLVLGRGLGVAIEFATLGEYGPPLEERDAEPPPSAGAPAAQSGPAVRPRGSSHEVAPHGHDPDGEPGWAPSPCARLRPPRRAAVRRRPAPERAAQPCLSAGTQAPP
jgi:hypothetical protein